MGSPPVSVVNVAPPLVDRRIPDPRTATKTRWEFVGSTARLEQFEEISVDQVVPPLVLRR